MTLTHFLAEMIKDKFPEVDGWEMDLSHLKEGHKGRFILLFSSILNYVNY